VRSLDVLKIAVIMNYGTLRAADHDP